MVAPSNNIAKARQDGLVSVIIPAFNAAKSLRRCIDHALGQTYSNIEVIVVNDGSSDETESIGQGYGKRIVYVSQERGGVSSARNRGLELSRGEFVAFVDHDDYWNERFVET